MIKLLLLSAILGGPSEPEVIPNNFLMGSVDPIANAELVQKLVKNPINTECIGCEPQLDIYAAGYTQPPTRNIFPSDGDDGYWTFLKDFEPNGTYNSVATVQIYGAEPSDGSCNFDNKGNEDSSDDECIPATGCKLLTRVNILLEKGYEITSVAVGTTQNYTELQPTAGEYDEDLYGGLWGYGFYAEPTCGARIITTVRVGWVEKDSQGQIFDSGLIYIPLAVECKDCVIN